ncbi:MAG: hypothetical protein KBC06_00125 [Candidatus Pacebacteria bacterium]|nr:hypothetical protein [Candidatus Paceibacterota bacterium]
MMFLIVSVAFITFKEGTPLFITILVFSVIGPFFEWLVGISYSKIVGRRLWTYHRGTIHGYTSYLAMPLWAFCGAISWIIIKYLVA